MKPALNYAGSVGLKEGTKLGNLGQSYLVFADNHSNYFFQPGITGV